MKNIKNKIAGLLICALLFCTILPMTAWAEPTWEDAMATTDEYLKVNSTDDAWSVFARGRNPDADHTEDYYINYYESLDIDTLNTSGDYAKTLLALRAIGRGDSDKAEELKEKLMNWTDNEAWLTGSTYDIPVVIKSLSGELSEDENAAEREGLIAGIAASLASHYYAWGSEDVDSTVSAGAALTTVDGYDAEINAILSWVKGMQDTDGNISGGWGKSPETTAQTIVLLSELGIADNAEYCHLVTGKSTVDGLMTYYDATSLDEGGGFPADYSPVIRAQQVNYALVAYDRSQDSDATSLFDFSDVAAVYYISFDGNGASNTMQTQGIETGDTENLNANTLINQGYRFVGWRDADGNTYTNKQAVTLSGDLTLYAVWERIVSDSSSDEPPKLYLNSLYEDAMRVNSINPAEGEWRLNESGKWTLFIDGRQFKGGWIIALNPAAGSNRAGKYYFDANGEMLVGWQKIKDENGIERWYYLNPHPDPWYGACYRNTVTPDGYAVDGNGAWLNPNTASESEISKIVDKTSSDATSGSDAKETSHSTKKITVSVSVSGNIVSGSDEVILNKNASAYDALKALAKKMGWSVSGSSSYVRGIGGEMEKSAGAQSGWIFSVNGTIPNKSAGSYKLKDGDSVDWTFVNEADY